MQNLFIPNQPIHFGDADFNSNPPCYCRIGQPFYLPIQTSDITRFQLPNLCSQTIETGLITPSGFASQAEFDQWVQNTGNGNSTVWTYDSGTAKTAGDSKILVAKLPVLVNTMTAGIQYRFTVVVTLCAGATLHVVGFNTYDLDTGDDYVILDSFTTSGTHSYTWVAESNYQALGFYVEGTCAAETFTTVDSFTLQSWISDECYSICLKNLDGDLIDSDIATLTYYEDYVIGEIDWTALDVAEGCYYICLCDDVDISFANNLFTDAEDGTFEEGSTTGLTVTNGAVSTLNQYRGSYSFLWAIDSVGVGKYLFQTSSYTLKRNTTYTIEARVYVDAADTTVSDAYIKWELADFSDATTDTNGQVEPGTDNQTWRRFYFTFTTGTDNIGSFKVLIQGLDWDNLYDGVNVFVDQIRLYEEDIVVNCSQPVSIRDNHDCTLLLEYSNDNPYAGFYYPSGFEFTMRVPGWIGQPRYPEDVREIKNESGDIIPYYSESSEVNIMKIGQMPEWAHAALRIALRHDNISIDGIEYTKTVADYAPEWRRNNCLAPATVELRPANSAKRNTYC